MPKIIRVVNWNHYQHYKDRNPPWIKLYTRLIDGDSREFGRLKDEEKWQFLAILMLASRQQNAIPCDPEWISERLRLRSRLNLKALEATGMIEVVEVASTALAACKQDAMPEESREETEAETEKRTPRNGSAQHILIFEEAAKKAGVTVVIEKPDAIQLASALKACGSEERFREVCALWFRSDDEWISEKWGYAGRFIGKKLQALLNNGREGRMKAQTSPEEEARAAAEWAERKEYARKIRESIGKPANA